MLLVEPEVKFVITFLMLYFAVVYCIFTAYGMNFIFYKSLKHKCTLLQFGFAATAHSQYWFDPSDSTLELLGRHSSRSYGGHEGF